MSTLPPASSMALTRVRPPLDARTGTGLICPHPSCRRPIIGRVVGAMGFKWHPACFKCSVCGELLEHVSSYEGILDDGHGHQKGGDPHALGIDREGKRRGMPYCHLCYHEAFAPQCYHCKTPIIEERFISLDDPALGKRTYHEQHFFCSECGDPFIETRGGVGGTGELSFSGDGSFQDGGGGEFASFTVYKGYPYCEPCHVRLRLPKCKKCGKALRDNVGAVEALGQKWCRGCFCCEGCGEPFARDQSRNGRDGYRNGYGYEEEEEDEVEANFYERNGKAWCERCFSVLIRNEI
ncbi:hypothetical protein D9758_002898 [Tetrapyrgos nigripes]|uniref:LIM zinc-binding domain-containing protein n=1 Tax=Tetrapyrgos nigripes TaxID=182062 RepID=A0A8H5LTL1_9AGAR|nr:hypothetical protein D9758_002898 [Tetrapyrgos nigripes]